MSKINQKGFSLVEIMVAVGLLSVVSLGVMKLMETTNKNQKISEARNEELMAINNLASAFSARDKCRTFFENRTIGDTVNYDSTAQALYKGASLEGLNSKVKKLIIKADGARDASNGDQRVFLDVYLERKVNGQIIDKKITVPMVMQTDTNNKISSCMTNEDELKKSIDFAIWHSENKMLSAIQDALNKMCGSLGGVFDATTSNCKLTAKTKSKIACEGLGGYITSGNSCSQINAIQASLQNISADFVNAGRSIRARHLIAESEIYAETANLKKLKDDDDIDHIVTTHDIYKTVHPTPVIPKCGGVKLEAGKSCCNEIPYDPKTSRCCDINNDSSATNDAVYNTESHICSGEGKILGKSSYFCPNNNGGTWNEIYCEIPKASNCPNSDFPTLVSKKWSGVTSPCTIVADQWSLNAPTCTNTVTTKNPDSAACSKARGEYDICYRAAQNNPSYPVNCSEPYNRQLKECLETFTVVTDTIEASDVTAVRCKP